MKYSIIIAILSSLFLGCNTTSPQNNIAVSANTNANFLANKTRMTSASYLGVQIAHTTADGRVYLWFPGNDVILPGTYEVNGDTVCFHYGSDTVNAFSGRKGPNCFPNAYNRLIEKAIDIKDGDYLGLANSKTPPFVLRKAYTSLTKVKSEMGRR